MIFYTLNSLAGPEPADPTARLTLLVHDLRPAVAEVIGGLRLMERGGAGPEARLQPGRVALDRILANILSNAIKYSREGVVSLNIDMSVEGRLARTPGADQGLILARAANATAAIER